MLPLNVAVLDSETLSLKPTAVVYEIAYSIRSVTDNDYANAVETCRVSHTLDIFEQMIAGRDVDVETLKWQQDLFEKDGSSFAEAYDMRLRETDAEKTADALMFLQEKLLACDEVWIMKPSFDSPLLHSLATTFGVKDPLWKHRAEMDLRTPLRKLMPTGYKRPEGSWHQASVDVEHGWDILAKAKFPKMGV